jgi:hypothetical protein
LERLFLYPYLYTASLKTFDLVRAFMIYLLSYLKNECSMVTHGSRRIADGKEQFFHSQYGWLSAQEFFDAAPATESGDADHASDLEPDYIARRAGESASHFNSRIRDIEDYRDD